MPIGKTGPAQNEHPGMYSGIRYCGYQLVKQQNAMQEQTHGVIRDHVLRLYLHALPLKNITHNQAQSNFVPSPTVGSVLA